MIKKLFLILGLLLSYINSANSQTFPNSSWNYSVPLTIAAGASINSTVKVDVNFTTLLTTLGVAGTFDPLSVRVVRPNGTLATIQEFNDNIYGGITNPSGNGQGQVAFILEDAGPSTYQIYFDITANGPKTANQQTPINGNFEKGVTGQSQPLGWNAPTVSTGYDAQIRPSENPTITTKTSSGTLSKTVNGTPYTGNYSYLIGDRSDSSTTGVGAGGAKITKTITVPTTNPGNLVFKYRIEGWDSGDNNSDITGNYDYFKMQIIGTTTVNVVGPALNNYTTYPFSPNYGTNEYDNSHSGYGQYNGWDYDSGTRHREQDGNPPMTLTKGSEPWFTVTYPLTAFAGKTVTLSFATSHKQLYKTWVNIDDVEWSVISATLGTPVEYNKSANAANFNCLETGSNEPYNKDIRSPLYTKLVNTPFSFDIVALDSNGNVETKYAKGSNKSVTVEIFDATTAQNCSLYNSPIASTTATFTSGSMGRLTIPVLSVSNAYPKLICRVKDTTQATPIYGCSTDNFTIRPQSISGVSSNANADLTGTNDTAMPIIKAGNNFTITANTGTIGYNGIPKINPLLIEWLNVPSYGVPLSNNGVGTISGNFSSGASAITGNGSSGTFSYSEAGYFRFKSQGIYDDSFVNASADSSNNDCIVGSYSNTSIGGKYGCNFGTTSPSPYIGRFVPASFLISSMALINRSDLSCSLSSNFTYLDELFNISMKLTPINNLGQPTLNYARSRFLDTVLSTWNLNISNNLTSRLSLSSYINAWDSSGALNATLKLIVNRTTSPDGPFNNSIVTISPKDADNISILQSSLDTDLNSDGINDSKNIGATNFYFGRMRINNSTGSELLKMAIPVSVQYFNGAGFVTNTDDSCTPLFSSSFSANNFTQNLQSNEISLSYPTSFINGKQTIIMNKPNGGDGVYNGSFDLTYNLGTANSSYLLGKWVGNTYTDNPTAKIILSRQATKNRVFFSKDNY